MQIDDRRPHILVPSNSSTVRMSVAVRVVVKWGYNATEVAYNAISHFIPSKNVRSMNTGITLVSLSPTELSMRNSSKTKKRFPAVQFSLATLMALILVAALASSWVAKHRSEWAKEQASLEAMSEHVAYVERGFVGPSWLYRVGVRPNYFFRIVTVDISGDSKPGTIQRIGDPPNPYCKFDDSAFTEIASKIQGFDHLSELYLDQTQISDRSLANILKFPHVGFVNIQETKISESALHQLEMEMPDTKFAYHYKPTLLVPPTVTVANTKAKQ